MTNSIPLIIGVIFIMISLLLIIFGLRARKKALAARQWPTAPGKVISASLKEHRSYDSQEHRTNITYEPQVTYEYRFGSETLKRDRLGFGTTSYNRSTAVKKLEQYPQGGTVTVYINPDNPYEALLDISTGSSIFLMVMGGVFLLIGVVLVIIGI